MRNSSVLALMVLTVTHPLDAVAGDMFGADGDSDIPVVLSATRLRQSLADTPASVTIIDRQMIELTGVRELPELLRLVPGMVVGYESSSEAFVSQHGTSADLARRMQVLVDGRSIYQPLLAWVDWIGLPLVLDDIERIEVTRGPNSAAYGLNSFLGVVNIITRHPADVAGVDASHIRGENGVEDYRVRLGRRTGSVDWRLTVAGSADDGYRYDHRHGDRNFTDSKSTDSVYGRASWVPDASSALDVSVGLARMEAQQNYRKSDPYVKVPVSESQSSFLTASYEHDVGEKHRLRIQVSQSEYSRVEPWQVILPVFSMHSTLRDVYDHDRTCANSIFEHYTNKSAPAIECAANDPYLAAFMAAASNPANKFTKAYIYNAGIQVEESRSEFEINDTIVLSPALRAVAGLTFDYAMVDSKTYLNGSASDKVIGGFAHIEWRFAPKWVLNVGGSLEDDQIAKRYFTPRYALNWQFVDNQTLRLIYSQAVRSPDILEKRAYWQFAAETDDPTKSAFNGVFFQRGIAKGDAVAEEITSSEIGYYGRFDRLRMTLDGRLFYDRMRLSEHDLSFENFNIAPNLKYVMDGCEVAWNWRPGLGQHFQANYAYLNSDAPIQADNTNFVPQHSGSVAWWQDKGQGWQFGSTYYFYNDLRAQTYFWDRLDLQLTHRVNLPGGQYLDLTGTLQKRFSRDPELRSENGPEPHRAWIGLNYHFL